MYRMDGRRQFLVWAFLSKGLAPSRLNGDALTAAAKVSPIFPLTHIECSSSPSWLEITYIGRSRLGESVGGLVPSRGHFDWFS
jgi:hypothetical protein